MWILVINLALRGSYRYLSRARVATASTPPGVVLTKELRDYVENTNDNDATISATLTGVLGYDVAVATYTGSFELRRAQMIFSVADGSVAGEDARVVTFDFAKVASGAVVNAWDSTDFANLDANLVALWNTLQAYYNAAYKFDRLKVYKIGPAVVPPQLPVYDAEKDSAGTAAGSSLPPQVALTVTEKAGSKLHWGRTYWPAITSATGANSTCTGAGRFTSTVQSYFSDALDVFYTAMIADALEPVVYRRPLEARPNAAGATLPARAGSAWTITDIQVDDVPDVIRSRRFKTPLLRV